MVDSVAYQQVTDPRFAARVAATFTSQSTPGGLLFRGTCPRCGQPMSFSTRVGTPTAAVGGEPRISTIVMFCTAAGPYQGQPDGVVGCGAYWSLQLRET